MSEKKSGEGETVGLVGLGNAGSAMVGPLLRHARLVAYDIDARRLDDAAARGAQPASSPADLAAQAKVILFSLPAPEISLEVARAMREALTESHVIVECSTVTPNDIAALREICAPHGTALVDAAVMGGVDKLAKGETTFAVGAEDADFARVRPVLDALAEAVFHLGPSGAGMGAKLINNAVMHGLMVLLVEAAALARTMNVPLPTLYDLLNLEAGLTRPLHHRLGDRIMNGRFEGGMSTANARKDSQMILDMAQAEKVPLFVLPAAHTVYEIGMAEGLSELDYAAIAKLWERWLGRPLGGAG